MSNQADDKSSYHYIRGERVELDMSATTFSVRFQKGAHSRLPSLQVSYQRLFRGELIPLELIGDYRLYIYQTTQPLPRKNEALRTVRDGLLDKIMQLDETDGIEFASPVYRRTTNSEELVFVTNRFIVQFNPLMTEKEIEEFNSRFEVRRVERLNCSANLFCLEAPRGCGARSAVALANIYYESGRCVFANPDFVRLVHYRSPKKLDSRPDCGKQTKSARIIPTKNDQPHTVSVSEDGTASRVRKSVSDASFLDRQWHLHVSRVPEAWHVTRGAPSITIAILDDGIDTSHPEFAEKVSGEFDFSTHVQDARPKSPYDNHGTACAGIAVAAGVRASGVAPNCKLLAVRMPPYLGVIDEARMFEWVADQGVDIISCSWGPPDGGGTYERLPDATRAAIKYCAIHGRNGKGIGIFWAAGNGNERVSLDGYAANPDVIAVAASTSQEQRSWYSDFGPEISICAPSSGNSEKGDRYIFTTDRRGEEGYNVGNTSAGDVHGDYTDDFGGTSAAAPFAAGVAALVLSARPELSVTQLRNILETTADKIPHPGVYDASGHSDQYGYGRINTEKAIEFAFSISSDTGSPSIDGPESVVESSGPPSFVIHTGKNPYYVVEVTTDARLFDGRTNGINRSPDNFYGSWEDQPFLTTKHYLLPAKAWQRFNHADRLYYRVHTSFSLNEWVDHQVSTSDEDAHSAPFVCIERSVESDIPKIDGPEFVEESSGPPIFVIHTGKNPYYVVEVTTDAQLFDEATNGTNRTPDNFYGSWQDQPFQMTRRYTLQKCVWLRLKHADKLYYRIHTSADPTAWSNHQISLEDQSTGLAQFLRIEHGTRRATRYSNSMDLSILATEVHARSDSSPEFHVFNWTDKNCIVEVTTQPQLFQEPSLARNNDNFCVIDLSNQSTQFAHITCTLSEQVWHSLKNAERIYYRTCLVGSPDISSGYEYCSTPNELYEESPYVALINKRSSRMGVGGVQIVREKGEQLWRPKKNLRYQCDKIQEKNCQKESCQIGEQKYGLP